MAGVSYVPICYTAPVLTNESVGVDPPGGRLTLRPRGDPPQNFRITRSFPTTMNDGTSFLASARNDALALEASINGVMIGQAHAVRLILIALLARGHVLLEGDVGVGKTTLLKAYARGVGGSFSRIEGAVDLAPNDLLYYTYLDETGAPRIAKGPLLAHGEDLSIFFFNEINRARPQVHSVLLSIMAEGRLAAFNREFRFNYLTVFADRNRIEREETFELPAAARDRFMFEVSVAVPEDDDGRRRLLFDPRYYDGDALITAVPEDQLDVRDLRPLATEIQRAVHASPALEDYALRLWAATRAPQAVVIALPDTDPQALVASGASPRAMAHLIRAARVLAWLEGRDHVRPDDVRELLVPALAHRVFLAPVYELRRAGLIDALFAAIAANVPAP